MSDLNVFHGPNAGYVLDLYDRYLENADSVGPEWRTYFQAFTPTLPASNGAVAPPQTQSAAPALAVEKIVGGSELVGAIRDYGHLAARLDPLGSEPPGSPDLDPANYGLSDADLAAMSPAIVSGPLANDAANAAEAIAELRSIYCGSIGFDFDHVHQIDERRWLYDAVETQRFAAPIERSARRALLRRLTDVEAFERFLHQTYLGQKRFSLEGTDMLVPMLDEIVHTAASHGVREIFTGMAHRGRLNVMTHVLGKPYAEVIAAFEGNRWRKAPVGTDADPAQEFSGDVKYHLGARLLLGQHGMMVEVPMVLAPNPSHLEAVNPVVEGMVRATQDICDKPGMPERDNKASMAILIHGDAAFPGQGVVAETLNLSSLPGYSTGGTIHIIVNNQIGFTTLPGDSRSTLYAGDLAKGFEIPVVHVNADEVEACLLAVRMAIAYREEFGKDFLIDLIGYRRWGHNEGDEPSFTQPKMYKLIDAHPTVREIYAKQLVEEGIVTGDEPDAMVQASLEHLAGIRRSVTDGSIHHDEEPVKPGPRDEVETSIPEETLRSFHKSIHQMPAGFSISGKLARQWERRAAVLDQPEPMIDWAHGETFAFAGIIADGIPIRLTGQDAERGTFSQRHLVLHDPQSDERITPVASIPEAKASFAVYNSPLSEEAAVGFEYGYSVQAPNRLVIWEAQFGDFANGAQVMIDQFISAARSKWQVHPSLVMLLPHGYEGQGPEHSSGRLERFLQLAAQDNIRVANCTSSAQYFHLLRRQAARLDSDPRPLIVMTPKSLLRNPAAASPLADFVSGTFQPVLDDALAADRRGKVTRLVFCSGKVAIDLEASGDRAGAEGVAIARIEQLAPFQRTAITKVLDGYPNLKEIVWLQEEPRNMGAWTYIDSRLRELAGDLPVRYIGRPERASPAEGAADLHSREQARIISEAFADAPVARTRGSGKATNGAHESNGKSKSTSTRSTTRSRS
ncbi:MAG: 2-oxoglutarate dehydrogenase E1 component [Thermomicrobiales bacterium]|nr:2-oxoglutarate dehydrogenase E1 component [Thermomicrobiales bacterium]